ncbi:MAG: hypothetical protein D6753_02660 [Planctomycetota bacterium]|nr:MAG: hypothetical protein D6753_02660 [Planctomycetota bacterium]
MRRDGATMNNAPGMYLGVDGGGTKTAVAVGSFHPQRGLEIRSRVEGDSTNVGAIGWDRAQQRLLETMQEACRRANVRLDELRGACICLAGLSGLTDETRLRRWLTDNGLKGRCRVATDAHLLLAAAQPDGTPPWQQCEGIGLIAGTGSIALGIRGGRTVRSGGWGYLLGDEGSAFWLGKGLLDLACRAADQRNGPAQVVDSVLQFASIERPHDWIGWVYGAPDPRLRIASLAPLVFSLIDVPEVRRLVDAGAAALAGLVHSVARQLEYSGHDYPLVISGGVLVHQPTYVQRIMNTLAGLDCVPREMHQVSDPVVGALRLAIDREDHVD